VAGRSAQFGKAREGKKGILFFQPDPAQLNHHADTPWAINRPWGVFGTSTSACTCYSTQKEANSFHHETD